MKKALLILLLALPLLCMGQKYKLESSEISFYSYAPVEDIEAINNDARAIVDFETGKMAISIPIEMFIFDKSLMQEHFNEKYLESEKYPNATFSGMISDLNADNIPTNTSATGKFLLHGVSKEYSIPGTIKKMANGFEFSAEFKVLLKDHKIKVPKLMWQNIAEEIEVKARLMFIPNE